MQEEVTQKTIAFSIKSAKLTIQVLQAAARKFLETQNKCCGVIFQSQQHRNIPRQAAQDDTCRQFVFICV